MPSAMHDRPAFRSPDVLVEASLYKTLCRLGKARYGLRSYALQQIRDTLDRIEARQLYQTLLTLDEIGTDAAQNELHEVARHIRPTRLRRDHDRDNRASRFRQVALQTALAYARRRRRNHARRP